MVCKKCPHLVRHGQVNPDGKTIEFKNRCGLRMKENQAVECTHFPFGKNFDYGVCDQYLKTFKTAGTRNDVVPTSDMLYSEKLASSPLTEMELL